MTDRALPAGKRLEREFLPAVLEVLEQPPSPIGRLLTLSIVGFAVLAIAWAVLGTLDVVASAQGRIIPSGRVKLVQPADAGVVRAIHVREGLAVKAGDVLIELDPTTAGADRDLLARDLMATRVEVARLKAAELNPAQPDAAFVAPANADAELVGVQRGLMLARAQEQAAKLSALEADLARRRAELTSIQAQIAKLESTVPLVRKRAETRRYLADKQYGSELAWLEIQQQLVDGEGELLVQRSRAHEAEAAIASATQTRRQAEAEYARSLYTERTEAEKKAAELAQQLIKAEQKHSQMTLRAPIDGVVQQLAANTVGGVVTPAQPLMVVVPADAPVEVEAMIQNKDIGFVAPGQAAAVKVETFIFTKYGTIPGRVLSVARDAIEDKPGGAGGPGGPGGGGGQPGQGLVYAARIGLERTAMEVEGRAVALAPGMAVTVEIKTGERRLIDYVLTPLLRHRDEALKER
jgi:hemolysin D